jgi:hypothetical protein
MASSSTTSVLADSGRSERRRRVNAGEPLSKRHFQQPWDEERRRHLGGCKVAPLQDIHLPVLCAQPMTMTAGGWAGGLSGISKVALS